MKGTVTELRQTARASSHVAGYVDVLEGSTPILSFWCWEALALVADGDGVTMVHFKGSWHERIRVPLAEVRSAMSAASVLRRTEKLKDGG